MTLTRTLLQSPTLGAFPERIVDGLPLDLANRVAKGDLLINVQDSPYNAVGDVVALTDVVLLANSAVPATSYVFTNADVNKSFLVAGAGQAFVNRGAWAPSTAYVRGDKVTFGGQTFVANSSFTSASFGFSQTNWSVPDVGQIAYSLETTIQSVSGGVPTFSNPAITAVSGAQAWFGTDESTAFQAAIDAANTAGGGNVYAPQPKVGTAYMVQNVFITARVHLWTAPGVQFRLPATPANFAQVFTLGSKTQAGGVWSDYCGIHGPAIFDLTGINQGKLARGLNVTNPRHFHIEDLDCLGATEGNTVHLHTTSVFTYPIHGTVERISCTSGPAGYGAIQVAGGKQIDFADIYANGGIALRIEVDTQPSGCLVEDITAHNLYADAVAGKPATSGAALALVSHGNQIRNVTVEGLRATGGADLVNFNYDPTNPASTLDHVRLKGGYVDGGGCALTTNGVNNIVFTDFHVEDVLAVGTLAPAWRYTGVGANTTSRNDAFYHAGMYFENCQSISAAGKGWVDIFQSVTTAVTSWFKRCRGYKNTQYGSFIQGPGTTCVYDDCDFGDDPAFVPLGSELLTAALLDAQCGTAATQWTTGQGASAVARDTGHVYSGGGAASVAITADGTQNWAITHSPTGLNAMAVTAGHYYKGIAVGQAQATPHSIAVNIWWYDSGGAQIGFTNGTAAAEAAGQWVTGTVTGQAPVGAVRAAMIMQGVGPAHLSAGEVHNLVPLHFAEVAGIATQDYGIFTTTSATSILCRTTLANNGAGRTAGAGTVVEYQAVDAGVSSAVAAHHASHAPGATDPIDYTLVNMAGTTAAMPAAAAANNGLYYWASDSNGGALFQSNGSAWTQRTKGLTAAPAAHQASHQSGGTDALTGLLDANARLIVATGGSTAGTRRKLNLLAGAGVTLGPADDNAGEKVDVTITAASPWRPSYNKLKAANMPPGWASTSRGLTAGNPWVVKVHVDVAATVANMLVGIGQAGTAISNCFAGLYSADGQTRLGHSADQSTPWATTGPKTMSLTADSAGSLNLTADTDYYALLLVGAQSTVVKFLAAGLNDGNPSTATIGLVASDGFVNASTAQTVQTALPSSFVLSTMTSQPLIPFVGLN